MLLRLSVEGERGQDVVDRPKVGKQGVTAQRICFEELEPRLVFSADIAPFPLDFAVALPTPEAALVAPLAPRTEAAPAIARSHELVFVDARVEQSDALLADLRAQTGAGRVLDVVMLDAERDGIEQVTAALRTRLQLDAVHFITHAKDGAILLGAGWLDAQSLTQRGGAIASWGDALKQGGDLLFYGCDLAASASGKALVDAMAALARADVAASTNATGDARLGGDHELEYHTGSIETPVVLAQDAVALWHGLLAGAPAGGEFEVNTTRAGLQKSAAVAMDAAGGFVTAWQSKNQDGSSNGIYAQRYNALGLAVGSEFLVNTTTSNNQQAPAIAVDGAGDFVVTWESKFQDGSGWGVYARRFDALGVAQGAEFGVNTTVVSDQRAPAVAIDGAGDFVVTWQSKGQDGDNWGIYARRYDALGAAQGGEFRVNSTTAKAQMAPAIAMDATGDFVIAWENQYSPGPLDLLFGTGDGIDIHAQRYNVLGAAQGTEFRVNTTASNDQTAPALAMDAGGNFVIAWQNESSTGDQDIYARQYNALGTAQASEFRVNTFTTNFQEEPAVAMEAGGGFVITWQSYAQDGSGYGIYKQEFLLSGVKADVETRVNTTILNDQSSPAVAAAAGEFVIVWDGYGSGDPNGIYGQRYVTPSPNIAPTIALPSGAVAYTENALPLLIDAGALVVDLDSPDLNGGLLAVDFAAGSAPEDRLAIRNQGTGLGQIGVSGSNVTYSGAVIGTWSGGNDGATPLVISFNVNATPANAQALARNITYANVSDNPSVIARTVRFILTDGDGGTSSAATKTINVIAVNDPPTITSPGAGASPTSLTVLEGTSFVADVDAADVDSPQSALTYAVTGGADAALFAINAGSGVVSFISAPAFNTPLDANGDNIYELTVRVADGAGGFAFQDLRVAVVDVNTPPVITVSGGALGYLENAPATPVDSNILVSDDGGTLNSATVRIAAGYVQGQDLLSFGGAPGISATWNAITGTLQLNGVASVPTWQAALRSVSYQNSSDAPSTAVRTITFGVNDGSLDSSLASRSVAVTAVNDNPVIISAALANVAENTTAVTVVKASDVDSPQSALVYSIAGGSDAKFFGIDPGTGTLSFLVAPNFEAPLDADANNVYEVSVQVVDGAGGADAQNLRVTVTDVNEAPVIGSNGGGPTAAIAVSENTTAVTIVTASDVDSPAQTLTYSIAGGADAALFGIDAVTGAVSFLAAPNYEAPLDVGADNLYALTVQVADGAGGVDTQALTIAVTNVNEAPAVTTSAGTVVYIENAAAIAVDPGVLVADLDSATLARATVSINGGLAGEDVLAFSGTPGIAASWNAVTGTLELSGVAPVSTWESALRSVSYWNSSNNPHSGTRTLSFTVSDGSLYAPAATRALTVVPVNVAPALTRNILAIEGSPPVTASAASVAPAAMAPAVPVAPMTEVPQRTPDQPGVASQPTPPTAPASPASPGQAAAAPLPAGRDTPEVPANASAAQVPAEAAKAIAIAVDAPPSIPAPAILNGLGGAPLLGRSTTSLDAVAAPAGVSSSQPAPPTPVDSAAATVALNASFASPEFQQQLDKVREEVGQKLTLDKNLMAVGVSLSTGLSVGYVFWIVRGGLLLSSLLSSIPAWRLIDPLPVLSAMPRSESDDDEEEDSLPTLLRNAATTTQPETAQSSDPLAASEPGVSEEASALVANAAPGATAHIKVD